jgi:single-strand DNA-binding protein
MRDPARLRRRVFRLQFTVTVNRVTLIGNLGADPEVRTTSDGRRIVRFSVATTERWKDASGARQERTDWHRIAIFSPGLGKLAEDYLRKGSKVLVEGQLRTSKWQDQSGQDRYTTEIVLMPYNGLLTFLDSRRTGSEPSDERGDEAPF